MTRINGNQAVATAQKAHRAAEKELREAATAGAQAIAAHATVDTLRARRDEVGRQMGAAIALFPPDGERVAALFSLYQEVDAKLADAIGGALQKDENARTELKQANAAAAKDVSAQSDVRAAGAQLADDAFEAGKQASQSSSVTIAPRAKVAELEARITAGGGTRADRAALRSAKAELAAAERTARRDELTARRKLDAANGFQPRADAARAAIAEDQGSALRVNGLGLLVAASEAKERGALAPPPSPNAAQTRSAGLPNKWGSDDTPPRDITVTSEVVGGGLQPKLVQFKADLQLDLDGYPHLTKTQSAATKKNAEARKAGLPEDWIADGSGQAVTSLRWKDGSSVDPTQVPYVALPAQIRNLTQPHVQPGDIVAVTYQGRTVYALYADGGGDWKAGEGSKRLHQALGFEGKTGHDAADITYTVLGGSGPGKNRALESMTYTEVQIVGEAKFKDAAKRGLVE